MSPTKTNSFHPSVHHWFHPPTSTLTYLITDPATLQTIILDSVLDYDPSSATTSTTHIDAIVSYIASHELDIRYILETHVHADHLTGAAHLKALYPMAKTGIGALVTTVQETFSKVFNYTTNSTTTKTSHKTASQELATDGSQFDLLFQDGDTFPFGDDHSVKVLSTPGHTPACVCYIIGDAIFTGDTIFMPDSGTARCDFPGGSSAQLYASIQRLFSELPEEMRVFVGHDYQPNGREIMCETTIGEEKRSNRQLNENTGLEEFIAWRNGRDETLQMPKLIIPSLQVNLRNGEFPEKEANGVVYLKIPVNVLQKK